MPSLLALKTFSTLKKLLTLDLSMFLLIGIISEAFQLIFTCLKSTIEETVEKDLKYI